MHGMRAVPKDTGKSGARRILNSLRVVVPRGSDRVERGSSQIVGLCSVPPDRGASSIRPMGVVDPGSEKVLGHNRDENGDLDVIFEVSLRFECEGDL
jgi:hypothetical protein